MLFFHDYSATSICRHVQSIVNAFEQMILNLKFNNHDKTRRIHASKYQTNLQEFLNTNTKKTYIYSNCHRLSRIKSASTTRPIESSSTTGNQTSTFFPIFLAWDHLQLWVSQLRFPLFSSIAPLT